MRKIGITFLTLLISFSIRGQLVNAPTGREFGISQKFNPEFISSNNIHTITLDVDIKKDGDRIRDTFQKIIYHFYPNGNVKMISEINRKLNDTTITFFQYRNQRLKCEVKNDAAGMYSYCYTYDTEGRPLSLKYGRAARGESLTASIAPTLSAQITTEKYAYTTYDNQLHATLYNSQGRPYLKEIRTYDPNGYLTKYLQSYVTSGGNILENYTYNAHGLLASKHIDEGKNAYTISYEYDKIGNLQAEVETRDGEIIYRHEYVYNKENMWLIAELKREEKNQLIVITTYSYNDEIQH